MSLPVTYPERYPYWYTGMGTETLAPKKGNIPLFTVIFSMAGKNKIEVTIFMITVLKSKNRILLSNKSVFLSIANFLYDLLTTISICSFSLNITSIMFKLQYKMLSIFI